MSVIDEIYKAAQIGRTIGDPIGRGLQQRGQNQFEQQQALQRFEQAKKLQDIQDQASLTRLLTGEMISNPLSGLTQLPTENVEGLGMVASPPAIGETEQSNIDKGYAPMPRNVTPLNNGFAIDDQLRKARIGEKISDALGMKEREAQIEAKNRKPIAKLVYGRDPETQRPLVFDPETGRSTLGELPPGVTFGAKPGGKGAAGSLTENQKLTLIGKASKAGVEVDKFTNPETGEVDWEGISEATGKNSAGGQNAEGYAEERQTRILDTAKDLLQRVSAWNTGFGSLLSYIPGSSSKDFEADVNSLKANIAFKELAEMRMASKTGGALGQVSDKEGKLLESALGSLDLKQSSASFKKNLQKVIDVAERWEAAKAKFGNPSNSGNEKTSQIPEFETEEEAKAAGLEEGAPIILKGVKGKWSNQ